MDWSGIKTQVGEALPALGALVGGPAGGMVGSMVAGALGVEDNPKAVAAALADPSGMAELKRWAMEHEQALTKLALETLQAELADKANARDAHKHSPVPAVVTLALTVMVAVVVGLLFYADLPEGNREVAYMLLGQTSALWGASVTYWVGTTRGSADKNRWANGPKTH